MKIYHEETEFANANLEYKEYRDILDEISSELHNLSDELVEAQTKYLENNGYKMIVIEDIDILVSESLSFQELHSSLQQMPSPSMKSDDSYALNYLVSPEDLQESRKSREYMDIVEQRQKLIDKIYNVYEKFWDEEIKGKADSKEKSIVYFMAGLDKDVNADTLHEITGFKKSDCKNYTFNDDDIVIRK